MNDTATALGNQGNSIFANTSPGVVIVLALVALFAAITIAGLVYGAHQKRRRARAEAEVVEHADEEREATDGAPTPVPEDEPEAPAPPAPPQPTTTPVEDEQEAPPAIDDRPAAPDAAPDAAGADTAPAVEAAKADDRGANLGMADAPVTTLKGLGPKVATQLNAFGIATVGDLAALDDRAAQDLDARLGAFTGRMTRDRWLEQARLLAAGDRKGFEERFGKL